MARPRFVSGFLTLAVTFHARRPVDELPDISARQKKKNTHIGKNVSDFSSVYVSLVSAAAMEARSYRLNLDKKLLASGAFSSTLPLPGGLHGFSRGTDPW